MIDDAAARLRAAIPAPPELLLTLGSGLDGVADAVTDPIDVPVEDVPGLAASTVAGHAGVLRFGHLEGRAVMVQRGRVHLYEGHAVADVVAVVRIAAALGASGCILTNAAGGLDPSMTPGDVMVIADQINLTGTSLTADLLPDDLPFVDMAAAYDAQWRAAACATSIGPREGVYVGVRGPAFETPAEVAMLRSLGADAVGMSTVLEAIAARAAGLRVLGISSITNVHGPGVPTSHEEVLRAADAAAANVTRLLLEVLRD